MEEDRKLEERLRLEEMEARNKGERVEYLKEGDAAVDDFLQEEKEIDVD